MIPLGDSILVTPGRLPLDEARREIKKLLKAAGVSAEELLTGIREEREDLFEETYGRKSR